jgi:Arc/MetJ-type ribon-helix-helix transcriptional regulator
MEIQPTPDQKAFIKHAIESGRLHREEDAIREALSLWEERERSRVELGAALDEAESDLEAGHYTDYTNETLPQLAGELKREARALGDAKQSF